MNIRNMEYIVNSADMGHFGSAARKSHISQPTISNQIRQVEEYLGVTIFERGRSGVHVTPAGRPIVEAAREVLGAYQKFVALKNVDNEQAIQESTLRLGLFPTIAPYLLPRILPSLQKAYPKLGLHLIEDKTESLLRQMAAGDMDLAMVALPLKKNVFEVCAVFSEPLYLAVPNNHPLGKRKTIKITDLEQSEILLLNEGHCFREQVMAVCAKAKARINDSLQATSMETLKHMVANQTGVTLVPAMARDENQRLRYLPFAGKSPQREIGMIWRKQSPHHKFYRGLCATINRCMKSAA